MPDRPPLDENDSRQQTPDDRPPRSAQKRVLLAVVFAVIVAASVYFFQYFYTRQPKGKYDSLLVLVFALNGIFGLVNMYRMLRPRR